MQNRQAAATFFARDRLLQPHASEHEMAHTSLLDLGRSVGFGVAGSLGEIPFTRQFGEATPEVALLDSIGR